VPITTAGDSAAAQAGIRLVFISVVTLLAGLKKTISTGRRCTVRSTCITVVEVAVIAGLDAQLNDAIATAS